MTETTNEGPRQPAPPAVAIDQLLDEAWTFDCAIRLHEATWAATIAERLANDLTGHARQIEASWTGVDPAMAESLATEARAVRTVALAMVSELRADIVWPFVDMYKQMERLIHHEACAAADAASIVD